jgi:hypothetical protein
MSLQNSLIIVEVLHYACQFQISIRESEVIPLKVTQGKIWLQLIKVTSPSGEFLLIAKSLQSLLFILGILRIKSTGSIQ